MTHPSHGRRPLVEPVSAELDRPEFDALLVAAGRGDLAAFAAFYDRTAPVVFGLLRRLPGPDAERTTKHIYLELWRSCSGFDPAGRSAYATLLFLARRALTAPLTKELLSSHRVANGVVRRTAASSGGD